MRAGHLRSSASPTRRLFSSAFALHKAYAPATLFKGEEKSMLGDSSGKIFPSDLCWEKHFRKINPQQIKVAASSPIQTAQWPGFMNFFFSN